MSPFLRTDLTLGMGVLALLFLFLGRLGCVRGGQHNGLDLLGVLVADPIMRQVVGIVGQNEFHIAQQRVRAVGLTVVAGDYDKIDTIITKKSGLSLDSIFR